MGFNYQIHPVHKSEMMVIKHTYIVNIVVIFIKVKNIMHSF